MTCIYSYVVRYDSGFAPNPFYGYCTLATCKPNIRKKAQIGDWVVGSASNNKMIRRGGHLVYVMRITEIISFDNYNAEVRFESKKPFRLSSRKQSCGDNIYYRHSSGKWGQRDSFHSQANGRPNPRHVARDTSVDRVLVSNDFIYFGGSGPRFPRNLYDSKKKPLCKFGIGISCFNEPMLINRLEKWIRSLDARGYQGAPLEWITLRG